MQRQLLLPQQRDKPLPRELMIAEQRRADTVDGIDLLPPKLPEV